MKEFDLRDLFILDRGLRNFCSFFYYFWIKERHRQFFAFFLINAGKGSPLVILSRDYNMYKKTFTINEKKDLGLLKKVWKQERLSLDQGMNIRFQCKA